MTDDTPYCNVAGCGAVATTSRPLGMCGVIPVEELVCDTHATDLEPPPREAR